MSGPISYIFSDLAGVHYNYRTGLTRLLAKANMSYEEFSIKIMPLEEKLNLGKLDLSYCLPYYQQFFQMSFTKEVFLDVITDQFYPIVSVHRLLQDLSKKFRIGLLTNIYEGLFPQLKTKGLVADIHYEHVIQSYQVGYIKPDPKIFMLAQQLIRLDSQQILFIDDNPIAVSQAKTMGWQALLYTQKSHAHFLKTISVLINS